jgi:hypothetical protein
MECKLHHEEKFKHLKPKLQVHEKNGLHLENLK